MTDNKSFIDTNILVYAYDETAGQKHLKASEIISELWQSRLGIISIQVLQEFFSIVTKKLPRPLETRFALQVVEDFLSWHVVVAEKEILTSAIEFYFKFQKQFSFWDSLIVLAAAKSGARYLISEDMRDGQEILGLKIQNPFR